MSEDRPLPPSVPETRLHTFEDIAQAHDAIFERVQPLYDESAALPGVDAETFYGALDSVESEPLEQQIKTWRQTLQSQLSPETWDDFAPKLETLDQAAQAYNQLNNPHNQAIARAETERRRSLLVRSTDWDKLVDSYLSLPQIGEDYLPKSTLRLATQLPQDGAELTAILNNTSELADTYNALADRKLLRQEPLPDEEGLAPVWGDFAVMARDWNRLNHLGTDLASPERQRRLKNALAQTDLRLRRLTTLAEASGLHSGDNQSVTPDIIANTISRHLSRTMEDFDAQDRKLIAQLEKARPNMLLIQNAELLKGITDIDDPQKWISEQLMQFPPELWQGLGRVVIVNEPILNPEAHHSDWSGRNEDAEAIPGLDTSGSFRPGHNTLFLNIDLAHQYAVEVFPDSEEKQRSLARRTAKDTLTHEFMHKIHSFDLPISWLRDWAAVTEEEQVEISSYATKKYKEAAAGQTPAFVAIREDLCDSVADFLGDSPSFLRKAPLRVQHLNALFKHYPEESLKFMQSVREIEVSDSRKEEAIEDEIIRAFRLRLRKEERERLIKHGAK